MEIDIGAFQANLMGSSHIFAAPKVTNAQFSGGLMRYHSAPSSVLASLLDDDFCPASEDSDFARLLNDGIGSFSSLLEPKGSQQDNTVQAAFPLVTKEAGVAYLPHCPAHDQHPQYISTTSTLQEHLSQAPLSAISEHGVEETVDNYRGSQVPLSTAIVQQVLNPLTQIDGAAASTSERNSLNTGLGRQSSSPADFVMEENSAKLKVGGGIAGSPLPSAEVAQRNLPSSQVAMRSNITDVKCSSPVNTISSSRRSSTLLRQSSSPAGLLSQISLEDLSMVHEKGSVVSSSGMLPSGALLDRRGPASGRNLAMGGWDDCTADSTMQYFAALGQRKRGRVLEDKSQNGLQGGPIDIGPSMMGNFSPPSSTTQASIDCLEVSAEDSVLCKVRAKRGCATHPRSIAERQRRTKISERIRKLQDLVPNLDKQANIAEMLDEVVEYVKLLQRQVQELSINRPPCIGVPQQADNSSRG